MKPFARLWQKVLESEDERLAKIDAWQRQEDQRVLAEYQRKVEADRKAAVEILRHCKAYEASKAAQAAPRTQEPAPTPPAPSEPLREAPETRQPTVEEKRAVRQKTWDLIKAQKVRGKPKWCEGCSQAPATDIHHSTYFGERAAWDIDWLCHPCHIEADRGQKADAGQTGIRAITTETRRQMLALKKSGKTWQQVADQYGFPGDAGRRAVYRACQTSFPGDPAFGRHAKPAKKPALRVVNEDQ